jgi:hypothetical protein
LLLILLEEELIYQQINILNKMVDYMLLLHFYLKILEFKNKLLEEQADQVEKELLD